MLAKLGYAPAARLSLCDAEHRQEGPAGGHHRHVGFEHDEGVADRVDDALRQLPAALALLARKALLADILDRTQDGAVVIVAGVEDLTRVDQHGALANRREVVLDLEPLDGCTVRNHAFKQDAKSRNIPLPVAEVVDHATFGFRAAGPEGLVESPVG